MNNKKIHSSYCLSCCRVVQLLQLVSVMLRCVYLPGIKNSIWQKIKKKYIEKLVISSPFYAASQTFRRTTEEPVKH